ncbi:MAG: Gfo/Idh/MocA family oxidoreductase [Chloroflexi bacterium]|nr:Gfo/Idh/MocA family oxidoreductase [Chloroflexota bacterium]
MSAPIRIGVVGAGAVVVHGHVPSLQAIPGVQVTAICDTNLARAQEAATKFNIPHAFADYHDLIARDDIDAITVAVPNALHAPVAIAALNMGKHVLCEKPLATSVADGEAMVAAAEKAGKVLAINMSNRPRPEVVLLREMVQAGRFGTITYAYGRLLRRHGIPGYGSWFTRKELAGGGATMDIGVHMLDMVYWILGFPPVSAVRGEIQAVHGPHERGLGGWGADRVTGGVFDVDDLAAIHLRLANGGLVTIEVTWAIHARNEERIQFAGDRAGADYFPDLYGKDQPLRIFRVDDGVPVEIAPEVPKKEWAWAEGFRHFVDACRGTGQPVATGAEGLSILRLLDAAYRSAAAGSEIRFSSEAQNS